MNRRRFLGSCALGVGAVGGYIGWRRHSSPSTPDGVTVETKHVARDVLTEKAPRDTDFLEYQAEYRTTIAEPDVAERQLIDGGPVADFLAGTDFDSSYLIVVQNGMQSQMELVLETVSRRDSGLHLDVSVDAPQGGPDDLLVHSLLVRVTDRGEGTPETVSVDIEGYV